ncbi:MAG: glycosyltransferase family 2 protein [Actinobacteria bacterium]|nr:glycosyltransferase family 2 protein [Actinomycetota bacterium]
MKIINNKKVAVCILTYNRVNYLRKTVASVFNSNYDDYCLYVLNDNSTDNTYEYLKEIKKDFDFREIKHPNNIGMGANANWVLDNINSEFCLMLHDDDILEPDYMNKVLAIMEKEEDISIGGTAFNTINEDGNIIEQIKYKNIYNPSILSFKDYYYHHIEGLAFPWSGTMIRMVKVGDNRFDFDSHPYCADTVFLNAIIIGNKIAYVPEILFNSRVHKNQVTQQMQRKNLYFIYNEWVFDYGLYKKIFKDNNFEKIFFKKLKIAFNRTLFNLLIISPDLKCYFKFLLSKDFNIFYQSFRNFLRIIYKFFKLLFNIKNNN